MPQEEHVQTFFDQDVCSSLCSRSCDVRGGASNEGPRVLIWRAAAADPGQQALRAQFGIHLILQAQHVCIGNLFPTRLSFKGPYCHWAACKR